MLNIEIIPCLKDNYSYLIYDNISGIVGVVDPSEFRSIDNILTKKHNKLDFILNTHHHFDHIGGNEELKKKYFSKIVGSKIDKDRMRASQVAQWGITSAPVLEEEMNAVPHAENPNSKMAKMLKTEPEEAIKQFGLISMTTEDRNETGIDLIKKKKKFS